jgi:hypothetical protein
MDPKTGDILPVINAADGRPQIESVLRNRVDNAYLDTLQRNLNKIADNRFNQSYVAQGASAQGAANARKEIVNTLREPTINGQPNPFHDPAYAQAHANTIAYREEGNAFSYGQDILRKVRNSRDAGRIELETRGMTDPERELATQGLLTDMRQRVMRQDGSINTNKLNEFFNQGPVRQAMENILTPTKFQDLERYVKTEALMNNTMREINQMGGGRTNAAEIRTLLYALFDYKLAGLRLLGMWANGRLGDRFAQQMANKFGSGSIDDFNQVYSMLANNPRNIRSFADFVNGIASRGAATAGLAAGPNIPQGYEQKAMGGSVMKRAQRNKHIESAAANLIQAGTQPDQPMKDGGTPDPDQNGGETKANLFGNKEESKKALNALKKARAKQMKLARQQGFDTSKVYLHGTQSSPEKINPYFYVSRDPGIADVYARRNEYLLPEGAIPEGAAHMPVFAKKGALQSVRPGTGYLVAPDPTSIRSIWAQFDPTKAHEPDIMAAEGGVVRSKRATGGRIPEVDKMFKAAKKYVDSHTKPLLNAPDDAVVKALEIAKRRV